MRKKGFSLIESLVGISVLLVVFVSIFGVFHMGIKLVGKTKAKAGAISLAQEQMEILRNLSYDDVATLGGIPAGNIPQTEIITLNGIEYTRRTSIRYIDDPKDGEGVFDENGIVADYKAVRTELSWTTGTKPVVFLSNIVPKGIETNAGGGTLVINVFDAQVQPVDSALVHVDNNAVMPVVSVDYYTNNAGRVLVPGASAASSYEITVSKSGYSTVQTYDDTPPNINPSPAHLTIIEGETTEASFVIDKTSSKTVKTWEPIKEFTWFDSFDDWLKVSQSASTTAVAGSAVLEEENPGSYWPAGYLMSQDIGPISYLVNWKEFLWNNINNASTTAQYKVMYYNSSDWVQIPDTDLPGNSAGFTSSPIDLTGLATTTYPMLRLRADLSTIDPVYTPYVYNWQLSWDAGPTPLPNLAFNMQGQKTIGKDSGDNPIYKYSENLSTDSGGTALIPNLEFDVYGIIVDGNTTGYDVLESCPFQPVSVSPSTTSTTDLTLVTHASNTLLVAAKTASGDMIEGAGARLYGIGYDETQTTSSCGQAFFTPLSDNNFILEFSKTGYITASSTVNVSGQTVLELIMDES